MNPLSFLATLNPTVAPAAAVAPTAADGHGFEALLGLMAQSKSPNANQTPTAAKDARASTDTPASASGDASTLAALQSLEATLSGLARLSASAPPASTAPKAASAPLGTALGEAAGALVSAGPQPSLKAMLQADPTLGITDVQMKTFLGVAGGIPARSGATPLSPEAAWRPTASAPAPTTLDQTAATLAPGATQMPSLETGATPLPTAAPTATPAALAPSAIVSTVAAAAAPSPVVTLTPAAAPAPARKPGGEARNAFSSTAPVAVAAGASKPTPPVTASAATPSHSGRNARDGGVDGAAPAAAVNAGADAATLVATVTLANLPAFLADQASSLTSATTDPSATAAAATPAARTAQAVKELKISLDPTDLGEMTVKLRLANGKLSVSISVANPTTLGAIEDDRAVIAARLATGDQALEDLIIARQAPATEVSTSNGPEDSGTSHDGGSDTGASSSRPGARRNSGGGFRDHMV